MYACTVGNKEEVELLIAAGADASIKNSDGHTAMDICKQSKKSHPLIKILDPLEPMPTVAE
jgi:ankyrin repeat protein